MNYAPAPTASVMTPQARLTLCFCVAVMLAGPFGFIIGPVLSRILRRRAERLQPAAAYAAAQRSAGHFNAGQLWAMTACGVWGVIGLIAMIPMLVIVVLTLFA